MAAVYKRACVQVLTIFFATFLAGSFFNQVQLFVNDPTSVVRILGAAAPQTASFFMSYLLLLGLTTKPVLFLRIPREPPSATCTYQHRDCTFQPLYICLFLRSGSQGFSPGATINARLSAASGCQQGPKLLKS